MGSGGKWMKLLKNTMRDPCDDGNVEYFDHVNINVSILVLIFYYNITITISITILLYY